MIPVTLVRPLLASLRYLLVMTVLLGIAYPAAITIAAQLFPHQANGSLLIDAAGRPVGSALIGQRFVGPQWFHPRPSASDYAGGTSGGTNVSPASQAQAAARAERRAALLLENPDAVGQVPEDALTASASGLDPHISPAYAHWQAPRVARARGIAVGELQTMITAATDPAPLGYLGQDGINVTRLNLLLEEQVRR